VEEVYCVILIQMILDFRLAFDGTIKQWEDKNAQITADLFDISK